MSSEFVDVFFPRTGRFLRRHVPGLVNAVFPPDLQLGSCKRPELEVSLGVHDVTMRWPSLVPLIILGLAIGMYGAVRLAVPYSGRRGRPPVATPACAISFAFYSVMCAAALWSHCLLPRSHAWQRPAIAADVAGTGACAFSAAYACLTGELGRPEGVAARTRKRHVLLVASAIFLAAFLGHDLPLVHELLYVGGSVAAAVVVGRHCRRRRKVGRQALWLRMVFGGAALALAGIPLDAAMCRALGPNANLCVTLFAGCDLLMAGLYCYVREEREAGEREGTEARKKE
ncbi:hypothetical protein HYH03_015225 [Edaphochlamys debaryana]|uniref:Uncharacterized protein n=1 Tax=Edaphochlamys debaryana TaxID=47281 RepID=A0A836BRH2_9CHLO|nr:hypothetical protein HYH03_015225 [Edaphochlamys debaryana]|eukprot:KAG2486132.1 hypothetical protein HYH03_015225 [Edaphochlamys debaryana]